MITAYNPYLVKNTDYLPKKTLTYGHVWCFLSCYTLLAHEWFAVKFALREREQSTHLRSYIFRKKKSGLRTELSTNQPKGRFPYLSAALFQRMCVQAGSHSVKWPASKYFIGWKKRLVYGKKERKCSLSICQKRLIKQAGFIASNSLSLLCVLAFIHLRGHSGHFLL